MSPHVGQNVLKVGCLLLGAALWPRAARGAAWGRANRWSVLIKVKTRGVNSVREKWEWESNGKQGLIESCSDSMRENRVRGESVRMKSGLQVRGKTILMWMKRVEQYVTIDDEGGPASVIHCSFQKWTDTQKLIHPAAKRK